MSNFWQRSITGAVFITVLIGAILFGPWAAASLFGFFTLVGLIEFTKLVSRSSNRTHGNSITILSGLALYAGLVTVELEFMPASYLYGFALFPVFQLIEEFRKRTPDFKRWTLLAAGPVLIAFPFASLLTLGHFFGTYESRLIIGVFILLWTADTGAYLVGRQFGKRKLIPRVSPGKTIEGFAGGVFLAVIVGFVISIYWSFLDATDWIVLGLIMAIFGTLGDLAESMLKRSFNAKDSGNLLPGHGGVLDRFDGLLFTVPLVLFYLMLRY